MTSCWIEGDVDVSCWLQLCEFAALVDVSAILLHAKYNRLEAVVDAFRQQRLGQRQLVCRASQDPSGANVVLRLEGDELEALLQALCSQLVPSAPPRSCHIARAAVLRLATDPDAAARLLNKPLPALGPVLLGNLHVYARDQMGRVRLVE